MKEKPIVFSTEMVQAILERRKTLTRRVIEPQLDIDRSPYQRGDILWVKETWRLIDFSFIDDNVSASVQFKDGTTGVRLHYLKHGMNERTGWRSPRYMPRAAARIFLEVVKDVRVEMLQDITEEDAKREGIKQQYEADYDYGTNSTLTRTITAKMFFWELWDSRYAKHGYGWDANPYVGVTEFERIEK